ncbi:MAG: MlaD family protein [Syntrophobacteraceae bacterium]|jgi:paraquat-inducible protein B
MSKQANTKLIGGFVVGAVVLVISGILLFGSAKFFSHQRRFVLFFEDSVKGLNIGAAVDFKGVNIGTVKAIKIVLAKDDLSLLIPVFIEIDLDRISFERSESELRKLVERGTGDYVQMLIKNGLRAQLVTQSFVTGQLGIHLDFYPDRPLRLVGAEPSYTEIPTIESSLSAISRTLENIPFAEIADKFAKTMDGIEKLVNAPDLKETLVSLHQTVDQAQAFLRNLDSRVKPLATSTELTLSEARKLFGNAAQLARNLDSSIPPLVASLEDTSKAAGDTMKGANKTMEGLAGANSPVRFELIKALNEFSAAARSFRVLAEYLENHPEALIKGKSK